MLESLAGRSPRVIPCKLSGERDTDAARLRELAEGGTDLALDYLGQTPTANATLSAIDALKAGGTAVLVGGVRHDLALPYQTIMRRQLSIRGSFMFQRDTALECWMLMRSGAVDLSPLTPEAFPLGRIEDAIAAAPTLSGFNFAVLLPNG